MKPENQDLGLLADQVLVQLDKLLRDQSIVESILEIYSEFCSGDETRRLNILKVSISDDMRMRLHFECMCYCVFLVTLQSSKYFTKKRWFIKRPSPKLNQLFHGALVTQFLELCKNSGILTLREIQVVAISPEVQFGFGNRVDPIDRLEEYRSAFVKNRGDDLVIFGKRIGMALDPAHYPTLELIGGNFGKQLLWVSAGALDRAFNPASCR